MSILGPRRLSACLKGARLLAQVFVGGGSRERLNTAKARANTALAGDHKAPDLTSGATVRATTEFVRVLLHSNGAHDFPVLLVEERVSTSFDRLAHAHLGNDNRHILANGTAHLSLGTVALVSREGTFEGIVKAEIVWMNERTTLLRIGPRDDSNGTV